MYFHVIANNMQNWKGHQIFILDPIYLHCMDISFETFLHLDPQKKKVKVRIVYA